MSLTIDVDAEEMRQDPSFRLGYEFPEVLDAILQLATPPSPAQRIEQIVNTNLGLYEATHHAPQMLSFSLPREASLLDAVIGLAREVDLNVTVRLYDRVDDAVHDLWASAQAPDLASFNLSDMFAERQVQGRDLYLDITPPWSFPYRILHILLG